MQKKLFYSSITRDKYKINKVERVIEKKILSILKISLFNKISNQINLQNDIYNSANDKIEEAIQTGKIFYDTKLEAFNLSNASKEIKNLLQKTYNKPINNRSDVMYIGFHNITPRHQSAILKIQDKTSANALLLASISSVILDGFLKKDFSVLFEKEADILLQTVSANFAKEVSKNKIKTSAFLQNIDELEELRQNYANNIDIKIKNLAQNQINNLRDKISKNIIEGKDYTDIEKYIKDEYNISTSRSKLIAQQETKLFVLNTEKDYYGKNGIYKFKWYHPFPDKETSRPYHVYLSKQSDNGVIYDSRNPPIDPETGRPTMPGWEINCHCIAIWISE